MTQIFKPVDFPYVYLSGRWGAKTDIEDDWLKRTGCKYRCFSYCYVCKDAFFGKGIMEEAYRKNIEHGIGIMMDSSAFTFQQFMYSPTTAKKIAENPAEKAEKYKEQAVQGYMQFAKKERKNWDFYFNFDYVRHAPTVWAMQKRLEKEGLKPTPVFHGDSGMDWLKKYRDAGHKFIGIARGGRMGHDAKRAYLDRVFSHTEKLGLLCHGLAFTSPSLVVEFPWFSIDSTTWVQASAYGMILVIDPVYHTLINLHVSSQNSKNTRASYNRLPRELQKEIEKQVESHGFDLDKLRSEKTGLEERSVYNGWVYSHLKELGLKTKTGKAKVEWERLL